MQTLILSYSNNVSGYISIGGHCGSERDCTLTKRSVDEHYLKNHSVHLRYLKKFIRTPFILVKTEKSVMSILEPLKIKPKLSV